MRGIAMSRVSGRLAAVMPRPELAPERLPWLDRDSPFFSFRVMQHFRTVARSR